MQLQSFRCIIMCVLIVGLRGKLRHRHVAYSIFWHRQGSAATCWKTIDIIDSVVWAVPRRMTLMEIAPRRACGCCCRCDPIETDIRSDPTAAQPAGFGMCGCGHLIEPPRKGQLLHSASCRSRYGWNQRVGPEPCWLVPRSAEIACA